MSVHPINGMRIMTPRLPTDPRSQGYNALLKQLANRGLGYPAMMQATGLTYHQVSTRLHKWGVKLSDYRSGMSPESRRIIQDVRRALRRSYRVLRVR